MNVRGQLSPDVLYVRAICCVPRRIAKMRESWTSIVCPVLKIPLRHVVIALEVDVIQQAVPHHKVGGEVVDVGMSRVKQGAHGGHLLQVFRAHFVPQDQVINGIAFNILLQDPFPGHVHIQQLRHPDTDGAKPPIVLNLRLDFIAELIVSAGFVVDLFQHILLSAAGHQIGIAALPIAQQPLQLKGLVVHIPGIHGLPPLRCHLMISQRGRPVNMTGIYDLSVLYCLCMRFQ